MLALNGAYHKLGILRAYFYQQRRGIRGAEGTRVEKELTAEILRTLIAYENSLVDGIWLTATTIEACGSRRPSRQRTKYWR